MRARSIAVLFGLALTAGLVRAQTSGVIWASYDEPQSVVQAGCKGCTSVPPGGGDGYPPHYSHRERLRNWWWINSNRTCQNCGTWYKELDFVFGSCGSFNCGVVKRDLIERVPLGAYLYEQSPDPINHHPFPYEVGHPPPHMEAAKPPRRDDGVRIIPLP